MTVRTQQERSWRDLIVLHRLEYPFPITYLCDAVWGACYAVSGVWHLLDAPVLLAITANLILIVAALSLNTAVDIRTDEQDHGRSYVASAALRFGRHRAIGWAATEMTCALALISLVSVWLGRWLAGVAGALIIVLHLLYNLEPTRLKRRGLANPVTLGVSFGFLPCLVSYSAVRPDFDVSVGPIFVGLGILATGRGLWWSVPDLPADAVTGMRTPAVRYGAVRTLALSCLITVVGLGLLGWGLWWHNGFGWALLGVAVSAAPLGSQLALLRRTANGTVPRSAAVRRRSMTLVMIANVLLALLPLAAG
ncbi:MAG: UbiA family prenyltransferase [Sciscionella sp.]